MDPMKSGNDGIAQIKALADFFIMKDFLEIASAFGAAEKGQAGGAQINQADKFQGTDELKDERAEKAKAKKEE